MATTVTVTNKESYSPPPPYRDYESCTVPLTLPHPPPLTLPIDYGHPPPLYRVQDNNHNIHPIPLNEEIHPQKKIFCGCGTKTWTKIIACINIFFSIGTLVYRFVKLSEMTSKSTSVSTPSVTVLQKEDGSYDEADFTDSRARFYGAPSDPIVQIFEGFVALALGFALFAGAHYGSPILLLIWMIAAGVGILFLVLLITGLFLAVLFGGGLPLLLVILVILIPTGVQIFFFRIVSMHRRELIDMKHRQENLHQNHIQLHPILQPQFQFQSVIVDPVDRNRDHADDPDHTGKPMFHHN